MNLKEIANLRRSGNIDMALPAAQAEYERDSNRWSAQSYFWCLHDKCKLQQGDEAKATFAIMQQIFDAFGQDDEYMETAMRTTRRRLTPHAWELRDAVRDAKQGADPIKPCELFCQYHDAGELDPSLLNEFGWLIYYALKRTDYSDIQARKLLLNRYFGLNLQRPSILHSLILGEALRTDKQTPSDFKIVNFANIWGLENLRDEDWQQKERNGRLLPSNVERLITLYVREVQADNVQPSEAFEQLLMQAIDAYPQNPHLPRYVAMLMVFRGDFDGAIRYYKRTILNNPTRYYLWSELTELVQEPELQLGLVCKALTTGARDEYVGKVRVKLAGMLCDRGMYDHALQELELVRRTYLNNGWNLRNSFDEVMARIPEGTIPVDNRELYRQYVPRAEEYVYSDILSEVMVKVAEKTEEQWRTSNYGTGFPNKVITWQMRCDEDVVWVKPKRFHLDFNTPNGTAFEVKRIERQVVWMRPMDEVPELPWLKEVTAPVILKMNAQGKPYGFIDNVYAPAQIVDGLYPSQTVTILAIRNGEDRWCAIARLDAQQQMPYQSESSNKQYPY